MAKADKQLIVIKISSVSDDCLSVKEINIIILFSAIIFCSDHFLCL